MEADIKSATAEDLDIIAGFRRELYRHDEIAINEARDRKTLLKLLSLPELGSIWLVKVGDDVAGYAIVTFCFSIEFAGRFALIDELYLNPAFRSRGLGGAVLRWLEMTIRAEDIAAIRLEVERSNVGAERLYRRHGFELHDRHLMTKWLDRPGKNG